MSNNEPTTYTVEIDRDNLFQSLREIEKQFDIRITTLTRLDVEDALLDVDGSDLTDEQWATFKEGWLWRKGWAEIAWQGVADTISDELVDLGIAERP